MNFRLWGLWANLSGTLLLLAARGFESGRGYIESGLWPYPRVGSVLYWIGLIILLCGFGLQLVCAYRNRRGMQAMSRSTAT